MNGSFDAETLRLLDETEEVRIETRRDENSPAHRTIVWVVTLDGAAFVRSVRGEKGRRTRAPRCTTATAASRCAPCR